MKISKLNQFNHTNNVSAGFTLIELLVSISIMGVVFALVGTGITFMVSSDQKLAAAQGRRTEISHALDVISYDIRKSEKVATSADSSMPTLPSDFTPVLFLNISIICNDDTIMPEQVIYSTKANGSSNILYRYGRIADKNDSISCSGNVPFNAPIADNITLAPAPATTPALATTSLTCAAPDGTPALTISGANGFYSCVSDNQVSIALFAKLNDSLVYGDNRTITSGTITSTVTAPGGSLSTATASSTDCTVPDLLTAPKTPNEANIEIKTNSSLSYAGIPITGGSAVITQTPSAGSKIRCKTGLVTYTY